MYVFRNLYCEILMVTGSAKGRKQHHHQATELLLLAHSDMTVHVACWTSIEIENGALSAQPPFDPAPNSPKIAAFETDCTSLFQQLRCFALDRAKYERPALSE